MQNIAFGISINSNSTEIHNSLYIRLTSGFHHRFSTTNIDFFVLQFQFRRGVAVM